MKMQMLGQEAEKIEQQIQAIDQQLNEMNAVRESIVALSQNKKGEILANLGKGIFAFAEVKSNDLLVNVGKEIIVKKKPEETLAIIDEQTKKLLAGKDNFIQRIQELQGNMQDILLEVQRSSEGHSHEECGGDCEHDHKHECSNESCECEEPCEDCECEKKEVKKDKKKK